MKVENWKLLKISLKINVARNKTIIRVNKNWDAAMGYPGKDSNCHNNENISIIYGTRNIGLQYIATTKTTNKNLSK